MDWEQLMTELRKKEDPKVYAELGLSLIHI